VLFLDARQIFRQIDRAHRDFTPEQIAFLATSCACTGEKTSWMF
jgi:hypothetical protein